ncbi:MAG: flavodoxin family protein [Verrucomicrobia bacterium]|nr:flavodoxin family protein [Verrucomicrobiota bacterium]MCG2681715.1 flavodoxin family protein [Kiritimatiellia bacterium]MBU4248530.1 flavodoxin family protein [Verrucomicrobiota bacterium]MBU4290203.1 flavodoxin family protein [Verrucomicrobiota bacterium]MBU4428219.1 flavodoxin family protein [Verrucomicrobiota bacterium]
MKNIFAFIGSPLKERSNTWTLTRMMTDRLQEMDKDIRADVLTAGHVNIRYCTGCWTCLTKGFCPLDKRDDMGRLKEQMLQADFIILGSPVYTYTVSGQMKTFLDRLAAWYHQIRLAGKPGLTVATTAGSGLDQVHNLLGMLLGALGVKTVATLETHGYFPKTLKDPEEARKAAHTAAEIIYPYLTGEKRVESDPDMEECFKMMKQKSVLGREWLPADYAYWEKNGMLDLNSYADLLKKLRTPIEEES